MEFLMHTSNVYFNKTLRQNFCPLHGTFTNPGASEVCIFVTSIFFAKE